MQTRMQSAIESTLNIGSGFILAMLVWQLIANPLFGYNITLHENFWLTCIFTTVSWFRSFFWRRYFTKRNNK